MGLFDFITGSKPKVKQYSTLTPKQQTLAGGLEDYLISGVGKELPSYGGKYVAGPSGYESKGLGILGTYMQKPGQEVTQGQSALKGILAGTPSTTITPETSEQFYQSAVRAPALKEFEEDILPQIREGWNRGGFFWGTPRMKAEGKAYEDLMDTLTSRRAEIAYADEEARRGLAESAAGRQLSALPQALAYAQEPLSRIGAGMTYGALPRQLEQQELQAKYSEWLRTRPETSPLIPYALQDLSNPQFGMYQEGGSPGIAGLLGQLGSAQLLSGGSLNPFSWFSGGGTTGSTGGSAQTYIPGVGWSNVGQNVQGMY